MAQVVLFHHILGLTEGVRALAAALGDAGHTVHTPDLYDGVVTTTIEEGAAHQQGIGETELARRVGTAIEGLPQQLVYAGISSGVMHAQRLAQTRDGALGALLYEACVPVTGEWAFGPWPDGVPVQVHGMDADPFFAGEGDVDAARELVQAAGRDLAQLFTYPGDRHLFTDSSLPSYDAAATAQVIRRSLALLARVDGAD